MEVVLYTSKEYPLLSLRGKFPNGKNFERIVLKNYYVIEELIANLKKQFPFQEKSIYEQMTMSNFHYTKTPRLLFEEFGYVQYEYGTTKKFVTDGFYNFGFIDLSYKNFIKDLKKHQIYTEYNYLPFALSRMVAFRYFYTDENNNVVAFDLGEDFDVITKIKYVGSTINRAPIFYNIPKEDFDFDKYKRNPLGINSDVFSNSYRNPADLEEEHPLLQKNVVLIQTEYKYEQNGIIWHIMSKNNSSQHFKIADMPFRALYQHEKTFFEAVSFNGYQIKNGELILDKLRTFKMLISMVYGNKKNYMKDEYFSRKVPMLHIPGQTGDIPDEGLKFIVFPDLPEEVLENIWDVKNF